MNAASAATPRRISQLWLAWSQQRLQRPGSVSGAWTAASSARGILGKRVGKRVPGRTMMRNPVGAAPVPASCHPSGMAGRTGVQPRLGVVRETVPQGVLQIYPTIFSIGILLSPRPDNSQGDLVFPGAGAPGSYFIAPAAAAKTLPSSTFPAPIHLAQPRFRPCATWQSERSL